MARKPSKSRSRVWIEVEISRFAERLAKGARVLDAGAGDQRYRPKFAHCVYESADFEQVDKPYAASTYKCDLRSIPAPDRSFDAVVFTQVMEHLPDPLAVLRELNRLMKPGGRLFYSAPLWFEEHEKPYDFYRYTQFGVRHLFESAGFEVKELRWLQGYLGSVSHQLRHMARSLPKSPAGYGSGPQATLRYMAFAAFRPVARQLAKAAARADAESRYVESGFPIDYMAIVEKRADRSPT